MRVLVGIALGCSVLLQPSAATAQQDFVAASPVTVRLWATREGLTGKTTAAGQGLKNIRARAETIEGGFSLTSRPGLGTALEVVLRT